MSDYEHDIDIDIESDDVDDLDDSSRYPESFQYSQIEKRAHHNALERKRRDHIKDSFLDLKNALPTLRGEKVASRAQILKKAIEYTTNMRSKIAVHQKDIEDIKKQNSFLEAQIRMLEEAKATGNYNIDLLNSWDVAEYEQADMDNETESEAELTSSSETETENNPT